jgi:hypothetical protein
MTFNPTTTLKWIYISPIECGNTYCLYSNIQVILNVLLQSVSGRCGPDGIVAGFTTTCAIGATNVGSSNPGTVPSGVDNNRIIALIFHGL